MKSLKQTITESLNSSSRKTIDISDFGGYIQLDKGAQQELGKLLKGSNRIKGIYVTKNKKYAILEVLYDASIKKNDLEMLSKLLSDNLQKFKIEKDFLEAYSDNQNIKFVFTYDSIMNSELVKD